MKLELTTPTLQMCHSLNKRNTYINESDIAKLLKAYLNYKGFFIGENHNDFKLSWNDFHKCFKFTLYEIVGNINSCRRHWKQVYNFLIEEGYYVSPPSGTWKHQYENDLVATIRGIDLDFYPKEVRDQSYNPWVKGSEPYLLEVQRRKDEGFAQNNLTIWIDPRDRNKGKNNVSK